MAFIKFIYLRRKRKKWYCL